MAGEGGSWETRGEETKLVQRVMMGQTEKWGDMSGLERFRRQSHQEGGIGEQRCETGRVRVTPRSCSDTLQACLHDTTLTANCSGQKVSVILDQGPPRHCGHPGWVILWGGAVLGTVGMEQHPWPHPQPGAPSVMTPTDIPRRCPVFPG